MKYLLIITFFSLSLFAYEKGYIDTHGGKKDGLIGNNHSFSNSMGLGSSLKKKQEKNKLKKNNKEMKKDKEEMKNE